MTTLSFGHTVISAITATLQRKLSSTHIGDYTVSSHSISTRSSPDPSDPRNAKNPVSSAATPRWNFSPRLSVIDLSLINAMEDRDLQQHSLVEILEQSSRNHHNNTHPPHFTVTRAILTEKSPYANHYTAITLKLLDSFTRVLSNSTTTKTTLTADVDDRARSRSVGCRLMALRVVVQQLFSTSCARALSQTRRALNSLSSRNPVGLMSVNNTSPGELLLRERESCFFSDEC